MGWLNDLVEMYDYCEEEIGVMRGTEPTLLPIAHSTQNAQIEIAIDMQGNFRQARVVDKENAVTIIPVTEDSSSRSGTAVFPHPLCDKLEYLAGDYQMFVPNKKEKKKDKEEKDKFEVYLSQLKEWAASQYACEQVKAVYQYVSKRTVMIDLVKCGVLETDDDGQLTDLKMQTGKQADAFVRFTIEEIGKPAFKVYEEKTVFQSFIDYYLNQQQERKLCYATGEIVPCADKHPAKIRNTGDKAKLISSNDASGYTFRGRFDKSDQAACIGYEASQKAHNALRWLVAKQGFRCDEQTIVAWQNDNKLLTQPTSGSKELEAECDMDGWLEESNEKVASTGKAYAERLAELIHFKQQDLSGAAMVDVIGLEAATIGRLSITFYQRLLATEYYKHLQNWYSECFWWQSFIPEKEGKSKGGSVQTYIGTPPVWDIVKAVCGAEANDKIKKSTFQRLIPCIVEGRALPYDMMKSIVDRVCKPQSFDSKFVYRRTLEIACALIQKYRRDCNKRIKDTETQNLKMEVVDVALDKKIKERSYLFGRLLATAQKIEEYVLYQDKENRDTNAERLMTTYSKKPVSTWKILNEKLRPYISKIDYRERAKDEKKRHMHSYYVSQLNEIHSTMEIEGFLAGQTTEGDTIINNEPLNELFLLGYYSQLYDYNNNYKPEENETVEENVK